VRPFDARRARIPRDARETHRFSKFSRKSFCARGVERAQRIEAPLTVNSRQKK
jgi:hypothetical protein